MAYKSTLFTKGNNVTSYLKPSNGDGVVDVINDYYWTISSTQASQDVGVMELKEYQIQGGQIQAAWKYWTTQGLNVLGDIAGDIAGTLGSDSGYNYLTNIGNTSSPYEGLYLADETGFTYRFPYFSNFNQQSSNSWNENSALQSMGADIARSWNYTKYSNFNHAFNAHRAGGTGKRKSRLGSFFAGAYKHIPQAITNVYPSVKTESPKSWEGGTAANYSISFDLLNTVEYESIKANWELVYLITHQNIGFRRNAVLSYPPCIYEVKIPGIRFMPAAYLNINVENLGQAHMITIDEYGDKLIPEAYRVTITINEMLQYSRNIHEGVLENKSVVTAISKTSRGNDNTPEVDQRSEDLITRVLTPEKEEEQNSNINQ